MVYKLIGNVILCWICNIISVFDMCSFYFNSDGGWGLLNVFEGFGDVIYL